MFRLAKKRGMIAGTLAACGGILPSACASPELNLTATERHESNLREMSGVQARIARQVWSAQEETRELRADLDRDGRAADEARAAADEKAAELAEALRVLRTIEEDLIAVKKRREAAAGELAALREAEAQLATSSATLAKLRADSVALAAEIEAQELALASQQAAAATRRAALIPAMEALTAATLALDAALTGLTPVAPPAQEAAKDTPTKK